MTKAQLRAKLAATRAAGDHCHPSRRSMIEAQAKRIAAKLKRLDPRSL